MKLRWLWQRHPIQCWSWYARRRYQLAATYIRHGLLRRPGAPSSSLSCTGASSLWPLSCCRSLGLVVSWVFSLTSKRSQPWLCYIVFSFCSTSSVPSQAVYVPGGILLQVNLCASSETLRDSVRSSLCLCRCASHCSTCLALTSVVLVG